MNNQDFTTTILFDQTPQEVFNAINNVRGWWSQEIEGNTEKLNDEFTYHYKEMHRSKMKIIESIANRKIVWLVLDNYFSFNTDKTEWTGTKIIFEIAEKNNQTQLHFTHQGLVPAYECYDACVSGWTQYIEHSLSALI